MSIKQKAWMEFAKIIGNVSVMQSKVMRQAFMEGFEAGVGSMLNIETERIQERELEEPRQMTLPKLHIVKNLSDSD